MMDLRVANGVVHLKGHLNESCDERRLAEIMEAHAADGGPLELNFEGVRRANSCGIAALLRVLSRAGKQVAFSHCPVWMVEQLNQIDKFFAVGVKVKSVLAPYLVAGGHDLVLRLIEMPESPTSGALAALARLDRPVVEDGVEFVPDFDPDDYFEFFKKQAKI